MLNMETIKNNETNKEEIEEDKLTNAIGKLGKWQMGMVLLILGPTKFSGIWCLLMIIYLAPATTFTCLETNLTDKVEVSKCYDDCVKYEYHSEFSNTIISQWELICDRAWLANFIQTVLMFGYLLGCLFFGIFADRYGRQPALLTACMMQILSTMIAPFCPTYWTFTAVFFLIGFSVSGTTLSSFTLIMEITSPNKREIMACIGTIPVAVGEMILPIVAYFIRTYDMFSLSVAISGLYYLSFFFIMPESPKWLISMERLEEASEVMKQITRWNKLPSENMLEVAKTIALENKNTKRSKVTYFDLIKTRPIRTKTICSCIVWFVASITFYGSNQYVGQTSSNTFISIFLAGAMQIPGIVLATFLSKYIGRRKTLISFFTVCAISDAVLAVPDDWFYVQLIAGTVGISCASGAFCIIYMYTTELFPTVARNMAMGASSTVSRLGAMIAPFIAGSSIAVSWLPPLLFTIMPLLGAITSYYLPETRGKKLPDHLV